jgi:hypothetical protein
MIDNGTIFAFRRYSAARSGWCHRMAALLHLTRKPTLFERGRLC